ncbi:MAG: helix-turn-helix transcriptional regulator [Deltaproteobacteria bacterium]|nr:helix-turn-helix transcriptional regulator [Deltaproteobacteria bacterium]
MCPFKEIDAKELAKSLGVDFLQVRTKHALIDQIIEARTAQGMTQEDLADLVGVSQAYVSRVESKTQTRKVTIDRLLSILSRLGYDYEIRTEKRPSRKKESSENRTR